MVVKTNDFSNSKLNGKMSVDLQVYRKPKAPRTPQELKKTLSNRSVRTLEHSKRLGLIYVFVLFLFLVILGLFLGGSTVVFEDVRFDTFDSYSSFTPVLPRVETVLDEFSSINGIISLREFMSLEVITGDWGILDGARAGINLICRPFAFVGSLIDNLFGTIGAFLNAFIV